MTETPLTDEAEKDTHNYTLSVLKCSRQLERGMAETTKRYKKCLKTLARCREALTRDAWEDGPTETEMIEEITDLLHELQDDKDLEALWRKES